MLHDSGTRIEQRLGELLAEWTERRQSNEHVSLEFLCRDEPQLAEPLRSLTEQLKQTDWLFDEADAETLREPGYRPPDADRVEVLRRTALLGAEELLTRVADLKVISTSELAKLREHAGHSHADAAARSLLDCRALTLFQLDQICRGRGKDLLFGEYLLLDTIGEGGMGRVYRALHRSMNRIVALKVVHPQVLGSPHAVARFQQEVAATARLNHPQIVASYDAGEVRGMNYLVMEHVHGIDLATLVKREGPLPVDRAVSVALQAAHALNYAHGEGVIHRDVKPSNLMVDDTGKVKLLDLGLARISEVSVDAHPESFSGLTGTGQVMGTVDYLPPEQARNIRQVDGRSDIYALGCTLYTLLHARPMFGAESLVARLLAHQTEPAPSLGAGRKDIPRRLEMIFQRMVAKRPQERYQTMEQVVAALSTVGNASTTPRWTCCISSHLWGTWTAVVLSAIVFSMGLVLAPGRRAPAKSHIRHDTRAAEANEPPRRLPDPRQTPPRPAVAPFDSEDARAHQEAWAAHLGVPVEYENSLGMRFRLIPPGEFTMGTPAEKAEALARETSQYAEFHKAEAPQRRVQITRPYYLSVHEVTQAQYRRVTGESPSHFAQHGSGQELVQGLDTRSLPVENVSWPEAVAFCNALSQQDARTPYYRLLDDGINAEVLDSSGYRLPTEAEWEFACRAGHIGNFCFHGSDTLLNEFAIFRANSGGRPHPVGSRRPNGFGLYDMHGNVWERCFDFCVVYEKLASVDPVAPPLGPCRVVRGGSWDNPPARCRSAMRSPQWPDYSSKFTGFRIAMPVEVVTTD